MKKVILTPFVILFSLLLLGFVSQTKAQYLPLYTFSQSSGTYDTLTGATTLASGTGLDNERYLVYLPFSFMMDNVSYSSIYIAMNGFISFGSTDPGIGYWMIASGNSGFRLVSGFDYELGSLNANTKLSYQTTGVWPNRVFTAQWKNMGSLGFTALNANFQIRLHELDNSIEIVYGSITLAIGSTISVQLGLRGLTNASYVSRSSSTTNWSSTTAGASNTANIYYTGGTNPSSGQTYLFTAPPNCTTPAAPSNLVLTPSLISVAGTFTAPVPAPYKYLVVRTPNVPLSAVPVNGSTYTVGASLGNGIVVSNAAGTSFSNTGLNQTTFYTYSVFAYNDATCFGGPVYSPGLPLSATCQTMGPQTYTWLPTSGSADFQVATNWSPNRNFTNALDTLLFNQGGQVAVTNITSQPISGLRVASGTEVTLSAATNDSLLIANFLDIQYGTTLTMSGASLFKLTFKNAGGQRKSTIDGKLILNGNDRYNAHYAITKVSGMVQVNHLNAMFSNSCITCTTDSLIFLPNSRLEFNKDSSYIPQAYFDSTSTLLITGIVNHGPVMPSSSVATPLGNVTIDCPQSVVNMNMPSSVNRIKGKLLIKNTGAGYLSLGNIYLFGKTELWKGNLTLFSGVIFYDDVYLDTGKVSIYATTGFRRNLSSTAMDTIQVYSSNTVVDFTGPGHQYVSILGQYIGGAHLFTLSNPSGATLIGNVNLTGTDILRMDEGSWTGSGTFTYGSSAKLQYNHTVSHTATTVEWPDVNGPRTVEMNLQSPSPFNRLYLPGNRNLTTLTLSNGVMVLDTNNLTLEQPYQGTVQNNDMIATNGSGQLYMKFATGNPSGLYPIGDLVSAEESSQAKLSLTGNTSSRYIGVRVTDGVHPNALGNVISRYWTISDTASVPSYSYRLDLIPDSSDITSTNISMQAWNGSSWQQYPSYCMNDSLRTSSLLNVTAYPLGQRVFTGFTGGVIPVSNVYTWNGSQNNDYQNALNWTPNRTTPFNSDKLVFNNGVFDSVAHIPTETIQRLTITNHTNVLFTPTTPYSIVYSIQSDNDTNTNELFVDNTSSFLLKGSNSKINFIGLQNKALIDGRLELVNTAYYTGTDQIDFTNCQAIISSSGILASGGNSTDNPFVSSAANLHVFGTYEHKYTMTLGYIPFASWEDGSNVNVIGGLSYYGVGSVNTANGVHQTFYNFTYNCPNQYNTITWGIDTVRNHLTVINTGTSLWAMSFLYAGDFIQTGGTLDMYGTDFIADSLYQTGGILTTLATSYPTYIVFGGQSNQQLFSCRDSSFSGQFNYVIQNPYGVHLVGTGLLASNPVFKINHNGGVTIKTNASHPFNTTLNLQYDASVSTLTYEYLGDVTGDSICFPAVNGPVNLKNNLISGHSLLLPFDRTILKTLTMTNGNIDVQNHILTLGSAIDPGTLTYTAGYIVSTTGYFRRWYSTYSLSTSSQLAFPLSDGQYNRKVYMYGSAANAISAAGTISARHQQIAGSLNGLSIVDGATTITDQTNSFWEFVPGNGLTMTGTLDIAVEADGMNLYNAIGSLRLMNANPVTGIHVNGSGTAPLIKVERKGLTLTNLNAGAFHIGYTSSNNSNFVYSVNNGTWNNPATWNINAVPNSLQDVVISSGDTVIMNSSAQAHSLYVYPQAVFKVLSDSMHVDSMVANNGSFIMNGGKFVLGPTGGGKREWTNSDSLFVYGGTMEVNGALIVSGDAFIQTGGAIIEDGNSPTESYPYNYVYMNPAYVSATGGSIQMVDPHSANVQAFYGGGFGPGHTLILGDGVSTTWGGSYGFALYTTGTLGNVIVKGSPSGLFRNVNLQQDATLYGSLSLLDSNAYFNMGSHILSLAGDLIMDTATTLITSGTLSFANYNLMYQQYTPSTIPQHLISNGIIQNLSANPTANFASLNINNGSAEGVRFSMGDFSYSGTMNLVNGKLTVGANSTVTGPANSASSTNGWLHGRLKLVVNAATSGSATFPIGDSLRASKVSFSVGGQTTQSITSSGYVSAQALTPDHPFIASSSIDAAHSVNRYYRIDTFGGIQFSNGFATLSLSYSAQDIDPLANAANFMYAHYAGGNWTDEIPYTVSNLSLTSFKDLNTLAGDYIVGENHLAPLINLQPVNQFVCPGNQSGFTVASSAGNQFQWEVNSGSGWISLMNTTFYSGVNSGTLIISNTPFTYNGYQYRCKLSNAFGNVFSSVAMLTVGSGVTPAIQISTLTGTSHCANDTVVFNTLITDGGSTPVYDWFVNGVSQSINSPSISISGFSNNDLVTCVLHSNSNCALPLSVTSNTLTMSISPMLTPAVSISANPGPGICTGTSVTFTATPVNGGTNPSYQWIKNGSNVGTNSPTYTVGSLATGNTISCVMNSNENCITTSAATSNTITMTVTSPVTPVVTIAANPGVNFCAGVNVTFTATPVNGGTSPQYQWLKNGLPVGTNSNTYSSSTLLNADHISCVLTSSVQCVTVSSDTSNVLTMIVNPILTPSAAISVSPNDTVCAGTSLTFSAAITNPGTSVSYIWKNGTTTVSNGSIFSSSSLANGSIITLIINTNPLCASTNIDTSNAITMTILNNVTPLLTIAASPGNSICAGDSVTFTATSTFGGSIPQYQWKKNGVNVGTNSPIYGDNNLISGDQIQCILTSNEVCLATSTATSNLITITVNPIVTPLVSLNASPGTIICSGSLVSFTATPSNGGATPSYQWQVNGINVGTNSNVFSSTAMQNADVVHCTLSSSNACASPTSVSSSNSIMTVNPTSVPSVTISANPGVIITTGQLVTFTAVATNAGTTPVYQWKLNGVNVGANSNTFSSSTLLNADEVTCNIVSSDPCSTPSNAVSNLLKISIADGLHDVNNIFSAINYYPNPTDGLIVIKGSMLQTEKSDLQYQIISALGQAIVSGNIMSDELEKGKQIKLGDGISNGVYIIKLTMKEQAAYYRVVLNR